jgi:hypothetical protein
MSAWHPIDRDPDPPFAREPIDRTTAPAELPAHDNYPTKATPVATAGQGAPARVKAPSSDATSEYSTSRVIATPSAVGPSSVEYTIIPESPLPHHTTATAQPLPDLPFFGVVGSISSNEIVDLYRMHLNEGIAGIDFRLAADLPDLTGGVRLVLLDGTGQVLASSSAGAQTDSSIQLTLGGLPAGTTLFIGISAGAAGGTQAASTVDYQLWVDRQPPPGRPSDSPTASASLLPVAVSALLASPLTALAAAALPAARDGDSATPTGPAATSPLATNLPVGSLIVRPAGLSGGSLSEGDSATGLIADPETQSTLAQVRTAVTGINQSGTVERAIEEPARDDFAADGHAVVLIRGPGGFPLLGATPLGHGRTRSPISVDTPILTRPVEDGSREITAPTDRAESLASLSPISNEGEPGSPGHLLRIRNWGRLPVSLFSGLGIATVLTLNALLSQPMAGFDYLSTRFDVKLAGWTSKRHADHVRRASRKTRVSRSGRLFKRPQ